MNKINLILNLQPLTKFNVVILLWEWNEPLEVRNWVLYFSAVDAVISVYLVYQITYIVYKNLSSVT